MRNPDKTVTHQAHAHRFKPGQSGNPKGRPKGSRHRVTLLAEQLVDGAAEDVVAKLINFAKQGDPASCKLLLDRILPVRKDRPTPFALPPIQSAMDLPAAMASIADAVAVGELTLSEASEASRLIENYARAIEVTEIAQRLDALERDKANRL
jgi:hypothetical protein